MRSPTRLNSWIYVVELMLPLSQIIHSNNGPVYMHTKSDHYPIELSDY